MGKAAIHRRRPMAEGTRNAEEAERAAERKGINERDDD